MINIDRCYCEAKSFAELLEIVERADLDWRGKKAVVLIAASVWLSAARLAENALF